MTSNPYLSHLASRVKNDLAFLTSQGVLTVQEVDQVNQKLDQITLQQMGNQLGQLQLDPMHTGNSFHSQQSQQTSGNGKGMCKAVWDYNKTQPDDLGFKQGDVIQVLEEVNTDWWKGSLHGQTGLFPSNHVERLPNTTNRAPPPPPHPQNNAPYNVGYTPPPQNHYGAPQSTPQQFPYQQPQFYGQSTPAISEKSSYSAPPPPSHYNAPPPPPPVQQNVVVSPTAPMSEEEKKKKFPGGKFGKQVGTAFAGGMGFGAGSAITSNAINAIF